MKEEIREFLKANRCGDGGCVFGSEGMCTNGGCRCFHNSRYSRHDIRRQAREVTLMLRKTLRYLDETS